MTNNQICTLATECTTRIISVSGEYKTEGSGVVISDDGHVITAAHVIFDNEGNLVPNIFVRNNNSMKFKKYKPIIDFIQVPMPMLSNPFLVDLAYLIPETPGDGVIGKKITINPSVNLGDEVFMSGFPQDVASIIWGNQLNMGNNSVPPFVTSYIDELGKSVLIKKAMVGHIQNVNINDSSGKYSTSLIRLDNAQAPGASGGPIFNYDGELVGIITAMGLLSFHTKESVVQAPSGTGLAWNPNMLLQILSNRKLLATTP